MNCLKPEPRGGSATLTSLSRGRPVRGVSATWDEPLEPHFSGLATGWPVRPGVLAGSGRDARTSLRGLQVQALLPRNRECALTPRKGGRRARLAAARGRQRPAPRSGPRGCLSPPQRGRGCVSQVAGGPAAPALAHPGACHAGAPPAAPSPSCARARSLPRRERAGRSAGWPCSAVPSGCVHACAVRATGALVHAADGPAHASSVRTRVAAGGSRPVLLRGRSWASQADTLILAFETLGAVKGCSLDHVMSPGAMPGGVACGHGHHVEQ